MSRFTHKLTPLIQTLDRKSGGTLTLIWQSLRHYNSARGAEAAASLAYYGLFSLFPFTLFLIAVLGFVMESRAAFLQAVQFVLVLFPFSADLVTSNLESVVEARGAVTVIGLLGLLWTATAFFNILGVNINRAWPSVKLRNPLYSRLYALAMIGALLVLLLLSLISTTIIKTLPLLFGMIGWDASILNSSLWRSILQLIPALFTYLMFSALYRWVPNKDVQWQAVMTGALFTGTAWELGKMLFAYYLSSGLARFQLVYGSLGALIALMVWTYYSNVITLFGAHIVAQVDMRLEARRAERAPAQLHHAEKEYTKGVHG